MAQFCHHNQSIVLINETKEEIIKWMVDTQLGRRNLTPIQKSAIAEKYREAIEYKAKENQIRKPESVCQKSDKQNVIDTKKELAKIAGVSHDTYSKGVKILNSDDKEIKEKVLKGEMKINTAYF